MKPVVAILVLLSSITASATITGDAYEKARQQVGASKSSGVSEKRIGGVIVEMPITAQPLTFKVVARKLETGLVALMHDGKTRASLVAFAGGQSGVFYYYNSEEKLKGTWDITEGSQLLVNKLSNATDKCPITIEINRDTFKLERIKLSCDDLASAAMPEDAG